MVRGYGRAQHKPKQSPLDNELTWMFLCGFFIDALQCGLSMHAAVVHGSMACPCIFYVVIGLRTGK